MRKIILSGILGLSLLGCYGKKEEVKRINDNNLIPELNIVVNKKAEETVIVNNLLPIDNTLVVKEEKKPEVVEETVPVPSPANQEVCLTGNCPQTTTQVSKPKVTYYYNKVEQPQRRRGLIFRRR